MYDASDMPELPDVAVYVEALAAVAGGQVLRAVHLRSPFVLRSVTPPLTAVHGRRLHAVSRLGKRIVLTFAPDPAAGPHDELILVIHLMIAGRLRWRTKAPLPPAKLTLAVLEFEHGRLFFTEASSTKRASLQLVSGRAALAALDPGGLEPLDSTVEEFCDVLSRENHTLKRALTDPHLLSGIGNAYSDEILHAARLSPLKLTHSLTAEEWRRLHEATQTTLRVWIDRLRSDAGGAFPEKVTAFRDRMAVHGRYNRPCPVCAAPVQRIVYTDNECNYCAKCQTGGRRLADRAMSRLLKDAWPRTID